MTLWNVASTSSQEDQMNPMMGEYYSVVSNHAILQFSTGPVKLFSSVTESYFKTFVFKCSSQALLL